MSIQSGKWIRMSEQEADSKYIESFCWRMNDGRPELHVRFSESNGSNPRYRYFDVPEDKYQEFIDRTARPEYYTYEIDEWFKEEVRGSYGFQRYKD